MEETYWRSSFVKMAHTFTAVAGLLFEAAVQTEPGIARRKLTAARQLCAHDLYQELVDLEERLEREEAKGTRL